MMSMDITSKSAHKLLQQLESDPQLQSVEDTSILNDEQYPTSFESSITNLKDIKSQYMSNYIFDEFDCIRFIFLKFNITFIAQIKITFFTPIKSTFLYILFVTKITLIRNHGFEYTLC